MTNPPEDPGYRPPPPQGEPHYHGGGYQPPPPHQPPWQPGSHGDHGFPPGSPTEQTGHPYRTGKGFFAALFDLNFNEMISPRLIKVGYLLAILLISLTSLFILLVGLWALQFEWGKYIGIFLVPAAPVLWLAELIIVRILLEFVINQFKITEHLKAVRERGELH